MPQPLVARPETAVTKYVEAIKDQPMTVVPTPFGPGYEVLFDLELDVKGWKEIRVWAHVFVDNYETTPVSAGARLELRFMHRFVGPHGFDYEGRALPWNGRTSYLNGYATAPLIGDQVRLLCHPVDLPPPPFRLSVTYLLVR